MLSFLNNTGHIIQLFLALGGALILFVLAFVGYGRVLFIAIIVMIPFQLIDSKYGSINMAVTYMVGFAIWLSNLRYQSNQKKAIPLFFPFVGMFIALLLSWSLAPEIFWSKYFLYLIAMGSSVVLFYMSFFYCKNEKDVEIFFKALIFSNVLVVIYSIMQVFIGYGQFSLFGINELSLLENRQDQRLVGPFLAVGITAEYLVIQSLLLAHYMVQTGKLTRTGVLLLLCNMGVLIGTGNRGGFIIAVLTLILFLIFYKKYIGGKGVLFAMFGFMAMFGSASYVMITYTDFNILYERLIGTKMKGVIPETRVGWEDVIPTIFERPILGHGPRIVKLTEYEIIPQNWPKEYITFYPHSLYLFILYTTGIVGFIAYAIWAITYCLLLYGVRKRPNSFAGVGIGLPSLGMIVFAIFLIDQLKVEFLRVYLVDYQHYLAALFGMFASLHYLCVADKSDDEKFYSKPTD